MGDELEKPYDRPPLSKEALFDPAYNEGEPLYLVKGQDYDALELEERLGWRATSLNVEERIVEIGEVGETITKTEQIQTDAILLATGARAINIFRENLAGVYTLRSFEDCVVIRHELLALAEQVESKQAKSKRVAIVGAGFIGCEVAAVARWLGLEVSLIEMASQPLSRVLGEEIGACVADIHREKGVDVHLNTMVEGLIGEEPNRVEGLYLVPFVAGEGNGATPKTAEKEELPADLVIVGVGATPNIEWLEGSGLALDEENKGVLCDEYCLAAENIACAGDMASWMNLRYKKQMRVEHWDNAIEQSKFAVRNLLAGGTSSKSKGIQEPFAPIPWFWSDQYEHKIQLSGIPSIDSKTVEFEILDGSIEEKKFAAVFKQNGKVTGIFGLNTPRLVMTNRHLIESDFPFPP